MLSNIMFHSTGCPNNGALFYLFMRSIKRDASDLKSISDYCHSNSKNNHLELTFLKSSFFFSHSFHKIPRYYSSKGSTEVYIKSVYIVDSKILISWILNSTISNETPFVLWHRDGT